MDWLRLAIAAYAPGISALAAIGALSLAAMTLWYLRRDHESKYRPYIWGGIQTEPFIDKLGFGITILPKNLGSHPCNVRVSKISLTIGDETHVTPDHKDWLLLAPSGMAIHLPAGHVNETGVTNVREARYRQNRIEISFHIEAASVDKRFRSSRSFIYDIDVRGEKPVELFRTNVAPDA
jgi:hypothetical protein